MLIKKKTLSNCFNSGAKIYKTGVHVNIIAIIHIKEAQQSVGLTSKIKLIIKNDHEKQTHLNFNLENN